MDSQLKQLPHWITVVGRWSTGDQLNSAVPASQLEQARTEAMVAALNLEGFGRKLGPAAPKFDCTVKCRPVKKRKRPVKPPTPAKRAYKKRVKPNTPTVKKSPKTLPIDKIKQKLT
jgi:hypothetical protein